MQEGQAHTMQSTDIHEMDDDSLQRLYSWVDEIPLSRPKKNMARDFSDGGIIICLQVSLNLNTLLYDADYVFSMFGNYKHAY